VITPALLLLVTGSLVYCVLVVVAAVRYRRVRPPEPREQPPISILRPLAGVDEGIEENLASFFEQDYPDFEMLLAVASAADPVVGIVERIRARYPARASQLIVTGDPPWPNAKDYSLDRMLRAARHDLIVMADSDARAQPGLLAAIAAEFHQMAARLMAQRIISMNAMLRILLANRTPRAASAR